MQQARRANLANRLGICCNASMTWRALAAMDLWPTRGTARTTTNEISDKIAGDHSLSKAQSKAIVEAVFSAITTAAGSGSETSIPGLGKFKVKDTPEREARNPGTGATIKVAAGRKLTFTPAKALKDALNK